MFTCTLSGYSSPERVNDDEIEYAIRIDKAAVLCKIPWICTPVCRLAQIETRHRIGL